MLIPINDRERLRENDIHLRPSTLRKWHHLGTNPQIFIKITNRLFIDSHEWRKLIKQAKAESLKRAER